MNKESCRQIENDLSNKEILIHLRHNHTDFIPSKRVMIGDSKYYEYKCRKNWWNGIVGILEIMKMEEEIPNHAMDFVNTFIKKHTSEEFVNKEWINREDIIKANLFIDTLLSIVE